MMTKMLRALFVAWVVPFLAVGQERNGDPFNNPDFSPAKAEPQGPKTWEVMVEVYSVAFDEAAALRRELKVSSKLHAELSLKDGKVAFLGTMSPPRKNDGGKERRVRLVFATATAERK